MAASSDATRFAASADNRGESHRCHGNASLGIQPTDDKYSHLAG